MEPIAATDLVLTVKPPPICVRVIDNSVVKVSDSW